MEYIIEVKNLEKKYGNFKALNNLNIHIEKGSIYGLVGKNGAGKTTLIRLLCGLEEPTSGTYSIYRISNKDKNINKERQKIGAIIEYPYLYYNMNAYDNIKEVYKIKGITSYEEIDSLLDKVGLLKEKNKKVRTFSLGMKQRLMIACALVGNPDLLILDEPTNGLDPAGIKKLRDILKEIAHKENVAVFVSSHILSEMQLMCDKVAVIDSGKIVKIEDMSDETNEIEVVDIRVEDIEKSIQTIKERFGIEATKKEHSIEINISTESLPEVVKELAMADVKIRAVIPKEHNLEDIFFDATKGGE